MALDLLLDFSAHRFLCVFNFFLILVIPHLFLSCSYWHIGRTADIQRCCVTA